MAVEVFNRQELKFVINGEQFKCMLAGIMPYMYFDKHNDNGKTYRLYNLYIDTEDNALIRHSLSKPQYKEKLRIRSYHEFKGDDTVFLEVKKRYKDITNKRRTKITYADALALIETGKIMQLHGYMNPQVAYELEAMVNAARYYPKTFITYDRLALFSADETDDLRITFDTNITSRRYGEDETKSLLSDDRIIMELKSFRNIPMWLVDLLSKLDVRKQSFSKYGQEYLGYLRTGKETVTGGLHP